jgi:hypothetical protein
MDEAGKLAVTQDRLKKYKTAQQQNRNAGQQDPRGKVLLLLRLLHQPVYFL